MMAVGYAVIERTPTVADQFFSNPASGGASKVLATNESVYFSVAWSSVPEGPNVYRVRIPKYFVAPDGAKYVAY